jgi:hypothetical protein
MEEEELSPKPEGEEEEEEANLGEELAEQIEKFLSKIGPHEHLHGQSELIRLLRQVDLVLRQTYPGPVNPNPPPGGSAKKKCPHCGGDLP